MVSLYKRDPRTLLVNANDTAPTSEAYCAALYKETSALKMKRKQHPNPS